MAVAVALDQARGQALGGHAGRGDGQHHQARIERRISQADLQRQRNQERHRAVADPCEQVAQQPYAEAVDAEQPQREQRLLAPVGVQPVGSQRGHAGDQQHQHGGVLEAQPGQPVERE
ncbi:hypothetical protein D9M72_436530 [compost metagenome]